MKEQIWRCHDGRSMPISDMDDEHLANSINMINRGMDAVGRRVGPRTANLLDALELESEMRSMGLKPRKPRVP